MVIVKKRSVSGPCVYKVYVVVPDRVKTFSKPSENSKNLTKIFFSLVFQRRTRSEFCLDPLKGLILAQFEFRLGSITVQLQWSWLKSFLFSMVSFGKLYGFDKDDGIGSTLYPRRGDSK